MLSTSAWIARIDSDSWARLNAPATAAPEPASHVPIETRTATFHRILEESSR